MTRGSPPRPASRAASAALLAAALLALPGAALAQAPARPASRAPAIVGGEHTDFSRLVLPVSGGAAWSLRAGDGSATLILPGRDLRFDTSKALDRLSRGRVAAVSARQSPAGTAVTLTLGCDCAVSATRIDDRLLALDISPTEAPVVPPPKSRAAAMAARDSREASAVASAESALVRQLEHAAEQGVVDLRAPGAGAGASADPAAEDTIPSHAQVEAMTVFDRDRPVKAPPPPGCLPDDHFDLAAWTQAGMGFAEQRAAAEARLLTEFDAANVEALATLTRLYIRFGLGREAGGLLAAFSSPFPDRALLADLARVVAFEGPAPDAAGPLLAPLDCPGAHGLWQTLAGRAPGAGDAGIDRAFAKLPADARLLLGPAYVSRRLGAGDLPEAKRILDLVSRAGGAETPNLTFARAEVLAAERRPSEAARLFRDLAYAESPQAREALIRYARITLATGAPTPALATDLGIAAHLSHGEPTRPELLALSAETLGQTGDPAGALNALAAARAAYPARSERFTGAATRLLAGTASADGAADWARLVLDHRALLSRERAAIPDRLAIARRLLEIGLPAEALDLVAPLLTGAGAAEARMIAAEAELRLGHPDFARALIEGAETPDATALRARAEARGGAYAAAVGTLTAAGLEAEAAPYVFSAGDWSRARSSADPEERTLATYMARATPSEDATPAEAAFAAPLPRLDRPSLAAPRDLLANSTAVADFIRDLLAQTPPPATN
jgi:hypothetical protein